MSPIELPFPLPQDSLTGFDQVERNEYGLPAKQGLYVSCWALWATD